MPGWQGRWGNFKQWYDDRMDVLVVAGMIDRKLFSKILPLMKSKTVTNIYLVRRDFVAGEKITCFSPRGILQRNLVLAELYRVMAIVYVLVRYRPEVVIGIGLLLHGLGTAAKSWCRDRSGLCQIHRLRRGQRMARSSWLLSVGCCI